MKPIFSKFWSPKNLFRLIGIGLFLFALSIVDLGGVYSVLKSISLFEFFIGSILTFPLIFVRAFRWNFIKRTMGMKMPASRSFFYQLIGCMSFFTPGRAGELVKVIYLKQDDHSYGRGFMSIVYDRLCDLIVVACFGICAFLLFFTDYWIPTYWLTIPLIFIGTFLIFIFFPYPLRGVWNFLVEFVFRFSPLNISEVSKNDFLFKGRHSPREYIISMSVVLFISIGAFLLQVFRVQLFIMSLGHWPDFLALSGIVALVSLSNIIPISFSGLGTRDLVYIYFLGKLGLGQELALSLSLILFGHIVVVALLGIVLFTMFPPSSEKAEKDGVTLSP